MGTCASTVDTGTQFITIPQKQEDNSQNTGNTVEKTTRKTERSDVASSKVQKQEQQETTTENNNITKPMSSESKTEAEAGKDDRNIQSTEQGGETQEQRAEE